MTDFQSTSIFLCFAFIFLLLVRLWRNDLTDYLISLFEEYSVFSREPIIFCQYGHKSKSRNMGVGVPHTSKYSYQLGWGGNQAVFWAPHVIQIQYFFHFFLLWAGFYSHTSYCYLGMYWVCTNRTHSQNQANFRSYLVSRKKFFHESFHETSNFNQGKNNLIVLSVQFYDTETRNKSTIPDLYSFLIFTSTKIGFNYSKKKTLPTPILSPYRACQTSLDSFGLCKFANLESKWVQHIPQQVVRT